MRSLLIDQAMAFERVGDLPKAEYIYRRLIDERPEDGHLLLHLGNALQRQGRFGEASASYRRAVLFDPDLPNAYANLAVSLYCREHIEETVAVCRRAVALAPHHARSRLNLANALQRTGRFDEAISVCRAAIAIAADCAEAFASMGAALSQVGRDREALAAYREAIIFDPRVADPYKNLGITHYRLGQFDPAIIVAHWAARLAPGDPGAHASLGNTLQRQGRFDEAITAYGKAVTLAPGYAEAHGNLGAALSHTGRDSEAVAAYRKAIVLGPGAADAYTNLGSGLFRLTRIGEAIAAHRRAIRLAPDSGGAHLSLAHALLVDGAFEEGYRHYEWRWRAPSFHSPRRNFSQPLWQGEPFPGKTLLVHAEQGLGDSLQFCRYLPLLAPLGGRVVLECPPPLVELLGQIPGVAAVITTGHPLPPFDLHVPMLSLPRACRAEARLLPGPVPYLRADPGRLAAWRHRLDGANALRVGLVWAGNPQHHNDRRRSMPAQYLRPLAQRKSVVFHSLQKGATRSQLAELDGTVVDLGAAIEDFGDFAAALELVDLLITVDTAAAHLAGALGKRVWTLLPFAPDWRWRLATETSAWYPTMRLFRQSKPDDWAELMDRVGDALSVFASRTQSELRTSRAADSA
jgi:Flp pilus assembly protein TadD